MYIYGDSRKNIYQDNESDSFRIDLGTSLELDGKWEIAVLDIDLPTMKKEANIPMYVTLFCNVCEISCVDSSQKPVLYRMYKSDFRAGNSLRITTPRYVPISSKSLRTLDIYILDHNGEIPPFTPGVTTCTLHLRKNGLQ